MSDNDYLHAEIIDEKSIKKRKDENLAILSKIQRAIIEEKEIFLTCVIIKDTQQNEHTELIKNETICLNTTQLHHVENSLKMQLQILESFMNNINKMCEIYDRKRN